MTNEKDYRKSLTGLIFSKWRTVQTYRTNLHSVTDLTALLFWSPPHLVSSFSSDVRNKLAPQAIVPHAFFFYFLLRWYSISESLTNSYYSTKVPMHFSNTLTGLRHVKINLCIKGVGHINLRNGLIWLPKKCLCLHDLSDKWFGGEQVMLRSFLWSLGDAKRNTNVYWMQQFKFTTFNL